jgi:hypothetical protein
MSKEKHQYRILAKTPTAKLSVPEVFDALYSSFSYRVIALYFIGYAEAELDKYLRSKVKGKNIKSFAKRHFLQIDRQINEQFLLTEFGAWAIVQGTLKANKENPVLPLRPNHIRILEEVVLHYVQHRSSVLGVKISEKDAKKLANKIVHGAKLPNYPTFSHPYINIISLLS